MQDNSQTTKPRRFWHRDGSHTDIFDEQPSDPQTTPLNEELEKFKIEVEKRLCRVLEAPWDVTFSIEMLCTVIEGRLNEKRI